MVVVPTSKHVKLTYGTTTVEWLGRVGTVLGLVGVGLLVWWGWNSRAGKLRAGEAPSDDTGDDADGEVGRAGATAVVPAKARPIGGARRYDSRSRFRARSSS